MKSFVPRGYQNKDRKSRNSHHYDQDPGPVNAPEAKPFIRIYCKFREPKGKDLVGYFMIWSQEKLDPDQLHKDLNELYPDTQVFTIIQDKHFLVSLDHRKRWDRMEQNIRKTIEVMYLDDR